ncbi:hypothetical protein CerSpe_072980 [Prunus speciosa]
MAATDDGLKKLEYLSLVSKACSELETHIGVGDKVLAEFITELGRNCETVDEFDTKLKKKGAEMPDYFVRTLLTIMHAILPPKPKPEKDSKKESASDGRKTKFKALAVADNKDRVKDIEKEIGMESKEKRNRSEEQDEEQEEDSRSGSDRYREGDRDRHRGGRDRDGREAKGKHKRDGYEDDGDVKEDGDDRRGNRDRRNGQNHLDEPELYQREGGLVHVSHVETRRISNAKDVVKRDREVYVKVISISGPKLSLSMRDVDQHTGKDLLPLKKSSEDDALRTNPTFSKDRPVTRTGLSGIRIVEEDDVGPSRRPLKRMSSPEKWEAKQLIASGVLGVTEYPVYDEETDGMLYQEEGAEEELEIELNEDEPAFLNGQSRYSVDMSPVKIFKNPEGSLGPAAALQSAIIKERREVHEQQQITMLDSFPKDLSRPWEDAEEELEIGLNEDEPAFLNGQSRYSVDMSPVKIFKNPEGSLGPAAALQSALIKECREVHEQQQRTMLDSFPKDLNRPWEDPMPETGERHLAQELRGVGLSAYDMPEWKKDAFGKTISFGQRSKLSIH